MRLLFIRHAESEENYFMESLATKYRDGLPQPFNFWDELVKDMSREDGDAPLTPLGIEQADQLGTFYAPLLEHKAREGKLHLFVSPQRRTCQTASPLFGRLNAATGIRAHARVELHETGPPTHSKNDPLRRQADALRQQLIKAGELSAVEIEREYNSRMETFRDAWVPTGMSGVVMRDEFPWVEPPPTNGLEGLPLAEDEPWMNYGPETHAHALLRAQSNADWLLGLARDLQNDELVVCVSHGAIMGLTVRCMLGMAERTDVGFGDLPNTGVHVINLPRPGPPAANVFGMAQQPNLLTMEVFASTDHLGQNRFVEALARRSGTSLVEPPSEWLRARVKKLPPLAATAARI